MRSKGTVILLVTASILATLLVTSYFRSSPITSVAGLSNVAPNYDLTATPVSLTSAVNGLQFTPIKSAGDAGQFSQAPVAVRCGETMIFVQPGTAGAAGAVRVDCNRLSQSTYSPETAGQFQEESVAPPAVHTVRRRAPRAQQVTNNYYTDERERPAVRRPRSWEKEALIIGGSAGAGTALGAIAGGKKGAGIGAISGGVAGLVYDLATRDR
ncbi:MAG: hypothetical protein HYR55_04375 [Acidobacteria bacterium]|nr:hypothetical protein [Acidobacteriota bacterium]MBI3656319.1 hypothetical protein [Acidobacteriota bacterium]